MCPTSQWRGSVHPPCCRAAVVSVNTEGIAMSRTGIEAHCSLFKKIQILLSLLSKRDRSSPDL